MATRVTDTERVAADAEDGVERHQLVPPEQGSELALDAIRLQAGAALDLADELHDVLVFVHEGGGSLGGVALEGRGAGLVRAGSTGTLVAGPDGLSCVRATVGAATDLHAPTGCARDGLSRSTRSSPGKATGSRSFQVLFGPHNGSTRATMFVGYIPPGAAPWHYHLYKEIVWVLRGEGRVHIGDAVEALAPGSAFRLHAREVHVVENSHPVEELAVLGIFTPAGSPSAAYLTADVAASYVIAG